jgi:hypothetical protein
VPVKDPKKLPERIHTRLDESTVGIGYIVGDLVPDPSVNFN